MKKLKALSLMLAFAMLAALAAACGGSSDSGEAKTGGVLKIAINTAIIAQGTDPLFSNSSACEQVIQNYADTLVIANAEQSDFLPNLAKSWEVSDDGMTWTFHLRDDVHFHPGKYQDGRLMTADDVLYTYERELKSWNKILNSVESVNVVDDFTVEYHLVAPDAVFLETIVNTSMVVVCKEEVEGWGDEEYCYNVVGTGPYIVTEHVPDVVTKAKRNDNYWGVKPLLDGVEWHIILDVNQRMNALMSGDIHANLFVVGDGITQTSDDPNLTLVQGPQNRITEICFNTRNEKLQDVRVRRALTHAVDYEQLASTMRNGEGIVNYLPYPQTNWGWDEALIEGVPKYDVEEAKRLMAEAGYADGMTLTVNYVEDEARTRAVTMLEQFWGEIGVEVILRSVSQGEMTDLYTTDTLEVWASSQGGTGDPATFIGYFMSSGRLGTNYNAWYHNNPDSDQKISDALATTDRDERKALYDELAKTMIDECLGIFYGTQNLTWGVSNKVHGYVQETKTYMRITGVEGTGINVWLEQ